ncbi:hypothetical protein BGZ82_001443, partial [Podila clonocystis]
MADTFPFPLECLQIVISNLAIKRDLKTLATLLRVNKYVCLATLPILYDDPLAWFDHNVRVPKGVMLSTGFYSKVVVVIRLLLASVPADSHTGLMKALYNIGEVPEDEQSIEVDAINDTDANTDADADAAEGSLAAKDNIPSEAPTEITPQYWPIDYLSYVRHLHTQDQSGNSFLADIDLYNRLELRLQAYVDKHRLDEEYNAIALPTGRAWQDLRSVWKVNPTLANYLRLNIHRETTWALCSPILEQLQSIIIPLSDIDRYLDSIARFKSLAVVTFKLDELADINNLYLEEMSAEHVKKVKQLKEKRRQDFELAIQFVQIHTAMFRGMLKQVHCPEDSLSWQFNIQCCPADILDRMLVCLPTLIEPTELVNKNWKQFVAKAEHTDLERVTNIEVWDRYVEKLYDQLKSKPFLHRCPSLRKYNMMSLGPDSFKWAVQRDVTDNDQDQDQYQYPHKKQVARRPNLPPLESVSINALKESFGHELDDIGLGFGPTIKTFSIQGFGYQPSPGGSQQVRIGRDWKMPVLSRFVARFPSEELVLDPDFLRHCPSLRILTLDDNMRTYDLNTIQVAHPAHLPELTKLVLMGTGAFSFHPDTLHSTKKLKILCLGSMRNFHRTFLPSLESMEQDDHSMEPASEDSITAPIHRPKWTWDWYLPNMTMLSLSVEFSLHFQFQMLRGTPKLEDLSLCLYSYAHQVERVLTEADFILKSWDQEQEVDLTGGTGIEQEHSSLATSSSSFSKDPEDPTLHAQPVTILSIILSYLNSLITDRRAPRARIMFMAANVAGQDPEQQQDQPQPTPEQFQDHREHNLREAREMYLRKTHRRLQRDFYDTDRSTSHLGKCPDWSQERAAELVKKIEEHVEKHNLQEQLDKLLRDVRTLKFKKKHEKLALARLRAAHPEQLVAPSVKKLGIYGPWVMSEAVLETLLTRVFRNVKQLNECQTTGYSMDAFVRVTQSMPWLESVQYINSFDPDSLSEGYTLQTLAWELPPFPIDAANRV